MLQKYEAILFDMDGVIVDSEKIWPLRQPKMITQYYPTFPHSQLRNFMGQSAGGVFRILQEYSPEISEEKFLEILHNFAVSEIYPNAELFLETEKLMKYVQDSHKTAIASSALKSWVNGVVETHKLHDYFDCVVGSDDVGGASKPDPAVFLRAAEMLDVSPEKCLVIEDSKHGVLAGKNAGMDVFAFRSESNFDQDLSLADFEGENFKIFLS